MNNSEFVLLNTTIVKRSEIVYIDTYEYEPKLYSIIVKLKGCKLPVVIVSGMTESVADTYIERYYKRLNALDDE